MTYLNWKQSLIIVWSCRQRIPNKTYALIKDMRGIQPSWSSRPTAIFLMSKNVVKK